MDGFRIGICSFCQSQGRAYRVAVVPTDEEITENGEAVFFAMGEHGIGDTGIPCKEGFGSMPQALVDGGRNRRVRESVDDGGVLAIRW